MAAMTRCRLLILATLLLAIPAQGHDARPLYVQLSETDAAVFDVSWKVPATLPGNAIPRPTLPDDCTPDRPTAWHQVGAEYIGHQVFRCDQGLSGRTVGIEYPTTNPSLSTLYHVRFRNGEGL